MDSSTKPVVKRVLVIDDDEDAFAMVREMLGRAASAFCQLEWASSYAQGTGRLRAEAYDAVLLALDLGGPGAVSLLKEMNAPGCPMPFLVLAQPGAPEAALDALDAGAALSLATGDLTPTYLERAIRRAVAQKEKEQALRASEQHAREILTSINDGLFSFDRSWRYTYVNRAAASAVGREPQDLQGRVIWNEFPQLVGTDNELYYRRVMETRQPASVEIQGQQTGQWYSVRIFPSAGGITVHWINITPQKMAEKAREEIYKATRERESLLAALFANVPFGFAVLREAGYRFALANPAFHALFPAVGQFEGRTVAEVWPEKTAALTALLDRVYVTGEPFYAYDSPWRIETQPGGGDAFYTLVYLPMPGQGGGVDGITMVALETTEYVRFRREVEEELRRSRESENKFRAIFRSASQAILLVRIRDWVVVDANPYSLKQFEYEKGEVAGKSLLELNPGLTPDHYEMMLDEIQAFGQVRFEQYPLQTRTGRVLLATGTANLLTLEGVDYLLATFENVTELVQARQALTHSQELFKVAIEALPLMVYTCDLDLRYTWVYNPLPGFGNQELLGRRDDEILPPEAAREMLEAKQRAITTGQGSMSEVTVTHMGHTASYLITIEPSRDSSGAVTGLTCSNMDITVQRRLEKEKQQHAVQLEVQRILAEHREKERQEIAREIHDGPIQTLVGLLFNAQAAKEEAQGEAERDEFSQLSQGLQQTVRELREVVNELRPPSLIRFGLLRAMRMHLEDFRERCPEIEVVTSISGETDPHAPEQRLALFRIFQEALNNIARHASATRVQVTASTGPDGTVIEISDNGVGFDASVGLFEQTRRGHYGLVGMNERAEVIGGRLEVTSAPGQGAVVRISLP